MGYNGRVKPSAQGQSLVEVLVAIAVGAILIGGAASIMVPTLLENKQVGNVQAQTELADELANNVKAWAAGGWNNVLGIATGTANTYYLNTSSSPFTASSGIQVLVLGSTTFTRYFYATDIYRTTSGIATTTTSGNSYDPSTKLITVVAKASSTNEAATIEPFYLARSTVNVFSQTSWAGGSGQATPVTVASATYAAATSVSITASGTLTLSPPTGGTCIQ
jgi:prepilin-type N-terminal cleavage/methylation domain-containing protein